MPEHDLDLDAWSTAALLELYGRILDRLIVKQVVRSRNAPAGDLAETLVRIGYDGTLAAASVKSWDVQAGDRRLQVKCRVVEASRRRTETFSPIRSWDFDAAVFVVLDSVTHRVVHAREVPAATAQALARWSEHVAGSRITVSQVMACVDGTDVTDRLREAFARLDDEPHSPEGSPT